MPLQRVIWSENQRVDDVDLNRTNQFALANLTLALRHFLAPGFGIVRGGSLTPGGGMFVQLSALAAIAPNGAGTGLVLVEAPVTVGPFASNGGGSPRTDMVSVRYVETPATESRQFINPDTDTEYTNPTTQVQINAAPTVVITPGSSTAPSGNLAIGTVTIAPGQTVIAGSDIALDYTHRAHPLQVGSIGSETVNLPWESGTILRHRPRGIFSSLFLASLEVDCVGIAANTMLRFEISNGDVPIGSAAFVVPPTGAAPRYHTVMAMAVDGSNNSPTPRNYSLALRRGDGNIFIGFGVRQASLACITLGTPLLNGGI